MIVKLNVSGGDKTLNQVYKEMIHNHKFKENYDRIFLIDRVYDLVIPIYQKEKM